MRFRHYIDKFFTLQDVSDMITDATQQYLAQQAQYAQATAKPHTVFLPLGKVVPVRFDQFPKHVGVRTDNQICSISEELLDKMIFAVGEIGSGKTTGAVKLMQETATHTGRDIFFINYKGDDETNEKVRKVLYPTRGHVPVITLDPLVRGFKYNPFKYGDAQAIANRWIRILGLHHMEGNAEYFADLHRETIHLICKYKEVPRIIPEILRRLEPSGSWLKQHIPKSDPKYWIVSLMTERIRGEPSALEKFLIKISRYLEDMESFISEDGVSFDDGSLIISVPSAMYPDTAKTIGDVIVEDLKHFMHPASGRLKRPCFIVWDEFQAAENKEITGILSQGRQFNCGVLLATQDVNKLGLERDQKVLTSDTTTLIAFRTQQSAEFVAKMAGTVKTPRLTNHIIEGVAGDEGTVSEMDAWKIDPNDQARLGDGFANVVRQRFVVTVRFDMPVIPNNVPPPPTPPAPPPPKMEQPTVIELS